MPLARVGDIELSYERTGSGPPLLLIMGMSGTFSHWPDAFLEKLRGDFEVIVYDHRGVGESSPLEGPVTIAGLADDAAGLLGALGIESAHVLGISMGGMIAQELALAHPSRVRALILGCTWCGGPKGSLSPPEVLQRLAEALASGDREQAVRTAWEVNVSPAFAARQDAWEDFRAVGMRRAVAVPVVLAQMQACVAHDTSDRLGRLEMPTLIVHGSADEMIPAANARVIAALMPGARLEILDGLGHLFFWEDPLSSAELVREHASVGV